MTKQRRRGQGEGSIYQRAEDGLWVGVLDLGIQGGKRRRKYVYGATFRAVNEEMTRLKREHHTGLPIQTRSQTVADYLAHWLEHVAKPRLRPKTFRSYSDHVRLHIAPALGRHRLDRLSPQHVQEFLNETSKAGMAPKSVANLRGTLRTALGQAEAWGLVARNVAELVDPPRIERHEMTVFSPDQARAFLDALKGDRLEALYAVAVALGLRQGEAFGLRWRDADLDRGALRVRYALQRVDGRAVFVEPKTAKSRRTLTLPVPMVSILRRHRIRQLEERLLAGDRWQEQDLVFCTTIGTPLDPRNVTRHFHATLDRAGLPQMRYHDLRHTATTLMLAEGIAPRIVMEILGHSQIAMTMNVYAHVLPELERDAADRMGALLFPADEPDSRSS